MHRKDVIPHIHFTRKEFARRKAAALAAMAHAGLDGMLIFRQESMYWLTGYDTFGYVFFQCLFLSSDGDLKLLTRKPDLRQAKFTSIISDIRIWKDSETADPTEDLRSLLEECGARNKRLGVEWQSYGLTAFNGRLLERTLSGFCELVDASFLISLLRLVKSAEELVYVRRAGELADMGLDAVYRLAVPGAWEGDILAGLEGVMLANDGDPPANENIIGSGPGSFMGRPYSGRRHLDQEDDLIVEFAGVYRHYHAAIMRVMRVGKPVQKQLDLHKVGVEALRNCQAACKIGNPLGDIYRAFDKTIEQSGYDFASGRDLALPFSIGYCLGATFAPNWMDYPLLYGDNSILVASGMVFFMHMTLRDDGRGFCAVPGETIIVTEAGPERVSRASLDFRVNA